MARPDYCCSLSYQWAAAAAAADGDGDATAAVVCPGTLVKSGRLVYRVTEPQCSMAIPPNSNRQPQRTSATVDMDKAI